MIGQQDCPSCGARMSVDGDGYCNSCGSMQLFRLGDILDGYLVTAITNGRVELTKIDPTGPESSG